MLPFLHLSCQSFLVATSPEIYTLTSPSKDFPCSVVLDELSRMNCNAFSSEDITTSFLFGRSLYGLNALRFRFFVGKNVPKQKDIQEKSIKCQNLIFLPQE